ncbi:MAG TPA: CDP-alcohol phosphatidyltransferase family protein [Steroidobacteraceae bacterium]|jgi:cardiolipin synthase|nr:CDP-alcohol phosphatidyltransferase family protein [Steroidobacteraceae bacterium]
MKLVTVPNLICLLRIALTVPIVVFLAEGRYGDTLVLFAIAAASDILDGYLAKTFGWTSEVGKVLDPLADKLLLVSVFITLAVIGLVPAWLAAIAVLRDVVIGVGAGTYKLLFGPLEGRPTVPSKINTLVQLLYVIAVVWNAAFHDLPDAAIRAFGALVLVTTVVSGVDYVLTYTRKAIAVSRRRRGAA